MDASLTSLEQRGCCFARLAISMAPSIGCMMTSRGSRLRLSLPLLTHIHEHRRSARVKLGGCGRAILHEHLRRVLSEWIAQAIKVDLRSAWIQPIPYSPRGARAAHSIDIRVDPALVGGRWRLAISCGSRQAIAGTRDASHPITTRSIALRNRCGASAQLRAALIGLSEAGEP